MKKIRQLRDSEVLWAKLTMAPHYIVNQAVRDLMASSTRHCKLFALTWGATISTVLGVPHLHSTPQRLPQRAFCGPGFTGLSAHVPALGFDWLMSEQDTGLLVLQDSGLNSEQPKGKPRPKPNINTKVL